MSSRNRATCEADLFVQCSTHSVCHHIGLFFKGNEACQLSPRQPRALIDFARRALRFQSRKEREPLLFLRPTTWEIAFFFSEGD